MKSKEKTVKFEVDKETREALENGTSPEVRRRIEELRAWRMRSDHIFPYYP